jgi:hypothetical protein
MDAPAPTQLTELNDEEVSRLSGGGPWPTTLFLAMLIGETIDLFQEFGASGYGQVAANHM